MAGQNRSLTVRGACSPAACVIDCAGQSRAFTVRDGARLTLSDLTVQGGFSLQGGAALATGVCEVTPLIDARVLPSCPNRYAVPSKKVSLV